MKIKISLILIFIIFFYSCQKKNPETVPEKQTTKQEGRKTEMKITSSAFKEGEMIPSKYTCDGEDISPQLSWTGAPDNTKSFALIADDPDAPVGIWVHWVIYNMPPAVMELKENFPKDKSFDDGTKQGMTDFRRIGYGGPCPPSGTHRYYFKLYALDIILAKDAGLAKKELLDAMQGHIIAEAQLMGKYKRSN
jgi:Raf kinase inhibitor-like YbhB/YbcL family protein